MLVSFLVVCVFDPKGPTSVIVPLYPHNLQILLYCSGVMQSDPEARSPVEISISGSSAQ